MFKMEKIESLKEFGFYPELLLDYFIGSTILENEAHFYSCDNKTDVQTRTLIGHSTHRNIECVTSKSTDNRNVLEYGINSNLVHIWFIWNGFVVKHIDIKLNGDFIFGKLRNLLGNNLATI